MELQLWRNANKIQRLYCCRDGSLLCYATLRFQTISSGTAILWR
jgi:hypothetical protein